MENMPVYPASKIQKALIVKRVQQILADPDGPEVPRLEAEINRLAYELYGLTEEEIAVVEGKDENRGGPGAS